MTMGMSPRCGSALGATDGAADAAAVVSVVAPGEATDAEEALGALVGEERLRPPSTRR
jgi:hypothetical protein